MNISNIEVNTQSSPKMIFDNIIDSCKYVMDNAKYVTINYSKLDEFITTINCNDLKHWLSNNPYNIFDLGIENVINFMLLFESIDYSFWGTPKWTIDTELGLKDGSDALLYAMLKYVKENSIENLYNISYEEFKLMLKGNIEIPFIKERYETLIEVSRIVKDKMNGNFYKYVYDIHSDIKLFEVIISNFPSFKDERKYNDKTIYFYKLAQLLTSDILHLREQMENIKVDYSHLIGCADYKIPQTLRALEITKYNEELSNVIDNKIEIEYSSKYEVEIRSSQIVVIDYIKNKLNNVNSIDINDYLFTYSKEVKNIAKPYHLCRNKNY